MSKFDKNYVEQQNSSLGDHSNSTITGTSTESARSGIPEFHVGYTSNVVPTFTADDVCKGSQLQAYITELVNYFARVRTVRFYLTGNAFGAGGSYYRRGYIPSPYTGTSNFSGGEAEYTNYNAGNDVHEQHFIDSLNRIKTFITDNGLVEDRIAYYCHGSCHHNCHGSRGRR